MVIDVLKDSERVATHQLSLVPSKLPALVEHNPQIAIEALLQLIQLEAPELNGM